MAGYGVLAALVAVGLTPHEKLVLMALGYSSDQDGHCWTTMSELEDLTGMSPEEIETVWQDLTHRKLIKSGVIHHPVTGELRQATRINARLLDSMRRENTGGAW